MIDRYRVLLGAGVLAGGMSAAMLAGAGVAAADDGSSSADSGAPSSARSGETKAGPNTKRAERAERAERSGRSERVESRRAAAAARADDDERDVDSEPAETETEEPGEAPRTETKPEPQTNPQPQPEAEPEVEDDPVESALVHSVETDLAAHDGAAVMRVASVENPWIGANAGWSQAMDVVNDALAKIYDFFTNTVQFLAGPLRAPFGSSVRAERSSLIIGNGVEVEADWYFPTNTKKPNGIIYFQHGMFATASFYSATAAYLAEKTKSIVVAPTLTWNLLDVDNYPLTLPETYRAIADLFIGDREALHASAKLAGYHGVLPERVVFSGHSAGGGTAVGVAGDYIERGGSNLAGVVMLDGSAFFGVMPSLLAKVPTSTPVYNLAADPSNWNAWGEMSYQLTQARPGQFTGVQIAGGRHSDSMQSASSRVQFLTYLTTGFTTPWNVATNEALAAGWISDLLRGTHTAQFYGLPGATLRIGWWRQPVEVLSERTVPVNLLRIFTCLFNPSTEGCGVNARVA
ncbi:alpha/beta hydrolase [Mycolicibacterium vaccae]|uniref:alpha/beta hydrolase n=1 Tax=Mycolicibacterium vaccae TaxID=1810 RepID=UPI003CEDD80E